MQPPTSQDWKRVGRKEREKKKYTLHYRGIDNAREGREGEHADSTYIYVHTRRRGDSEPR